MSDLKTSEYLINIQEAVNLALIEIKKRDGAWKDEPINWADLRCVDVEYVTGIYNSLFRAIIEEADPNCPSLHVFISEHIKKLGYEDIEIVTEW